jgi:ketosteroid isomerase-like protein
MPDRSMPPLDVADALSTLDALVEAFSRTDTTAYFACLAPEATFLFHTEPEVIAGRDAYRALWDSWVTGGWRVVGCQSSDRQVQLLGGAAVVTHRVRTTIRTPQGEQRLDERETVVVARGDDDVVRVVHEHLSVTPSTETGNAAS